MAEKSAVTKHDVDPKKVNVDTAPEDEGNPYPKEALGVPEHPFRDDEWPASPTTSPLYDTDGDPDAEPIK